ncbi:ABC transporter permease [Alkalitalea saponilacus]|uniref:ABC-type transport system, involved in lipoprotein release, permease component n=1 Tax=Alkalitalea saponilacus TaxID=889453 RepID=A0A1T5CF42_9BACT|nr:FtsX-like permease family protein [Alkalitalea saponilacus]ASB49851.1 ABC transporter permease [Alkalitalea saponilacus]SKB58039.1 ABC-type transport system, involved in lipoprotein release, permease component [Alkalitalea saponilacus]
MKTLLIISWRNIWRNPQRSFVMIVAIMAGLWGGLMAASLAQGLMNQRFRTGVEQEYSHLQIHHPEFIKQDNAKYVIDKREELSNHLDNDELVAAWSGRTIVSGMMGTATLTSGVTIKGIDPEMEAQTTFLDKNIIDGSYLEESARNPVLIGRSLAEKTKTRPGSRIVLTFQDLEGELASASFRVSGVFQTANSYFDETNVFVLKQDIGQYLGKEMVVNEIAIVLNDLDQVSEFARTYASKYPELEIRTWSQLSPQLAFYNELGSTMFMIILMIILMALAFGLMNTMLMSVIERIRELGMLMSIGMSKRRVFVMILLETTFLTLTGAFGGMLVGYTTVHIFQNKGINLGNVGGDSLTDFGFEPIIYPELAPSYGLILPILVIITAFATSIYPALKAIRLKPAEAVRQE